MISDIYKFAFDEFNLLFHAKALSVENLTKMLGLNTLNSLAGCVDYGSLVLGFLG